MGQWGRILASLKRFFSRSPFTQLLIGSVGAQLVTILWSPVLSRLYGPESFALMALFGATVGIIGNIGAWRIEQSIVTRDTNEEAWHSVVLSIGALLVSSSAILLAISSFFESMPQGSIIGELALGCLLIGCGQVAAQVAVKDGAFGVLSRAKISQAVGVILSSILVSFWINGLIWAQIIGYISSVAAMSSGVRKLGNQFGIPTINDTIKSARKIARYPLQGIIPSLADNFASALPVYYVVGTFSAHFSGQFGMIRQLIGVGVGIVSASLSQVIMKQAADAIKRREHFGGHLAKYFGVLAVVYAWFLLALFLFGETLIPTVFGDQWNKAGAYSFWVATIFAGPFLVSPFSVLLIVMERLALNGLWQISHFLAVIAICYFGEWRDLEHFLRWFGLFEAIWYVFYVFLIYRAAVNFDRRQNA